jgi:acetyl-CoA acetyltransferase
MRRCALPGAVALGPYLEAGVALRVPLVVYLVLEPEPHLVAHECRACGARFFDRRNACASCSGGAFIGVALETTGNLRTFTIVNHATPGVDPWEDACQVLPNINTLTRDAARQAYEAAGIGPEDLDLVELHDCFATAELVHYDNLMLCEDGAAVDFFESAATWRDGRTPVNVSGGLQSKGHPVSATGIANVWRAVWTPPAG